MKLLGSVFSVLVVLVFALTGVSYGSEGEVTIKRDNYGVGHVYADTVYGVYYGYGYAVAQDRLFQMEMAKRSTQGKVAEVLGEKHVEFDKRIRGNYNPISIQRQLDGLSESNADIFRGYAAGMNAWIEEVKKNTDRLMPKNFLGIPQTYQDASMSIRIEQNRGTENDMIVFTDDGIISWEVAPPGQSGFIAPDGAKSPHYDDQLKMYETFGKKRMWITEEDVEKNKTSEVVLKY
jgi:acyl-homoserine lactone acylase PvdQ